MWNRDWHSIRVRPRYELTDDDVEANIVPGWESVIYILPNRLLTTHDINQIEQIRFEDKACRVYPPFQLNLDKSVAGYFEEIKIPVGKSSVEEKIGIPERCVTSANTNIGATTESLYCHALRFDYQVGFNIEAVYVQIIELLIQSTWQWWLRSSLSPFRGPLCFAIDLDADFAPASGVISVGTGQCAPTWAACVQTQDVLGLEVPLSAPVWKACWRSIEERIPADDGLLLYADAIVSYMMHDDHKCILNLALCFEVIANKRHQLDLGKASWKIDRIIENTKLVSGGIAKIIKLMFIDRDHIAHGREPYIVGNRDDITIISYLEAVLVGVRAYIEIMRPGEVETLALMQLGRI